MSPAIEAFLLHMTERVEISDYEDATGLLIETTAPNGFRQFIGPFPKDTVDALEAIERLRAEDDPDEAPTQYGIRFLFPTRFADVPKSLAANHGPLGTWPDEEAMA